jgi:uncharacterized Tic20 family protein
METPNNPGTGSPLDIPAQQVLPNSTAALVLGIISIPTCICYGIVGLVCGIIAIILASKGKDLYKQNPSLYTAASYNNLNAGKVCGIIGTCLSGLFLLYVIVALAFYGMVLGSLLDVFSLPQ